jgi:hypothetical protein
MLRSIGHASILALLISLLSAEPARSNQESPSAGIEGARSGAKEKEKSSAAGKKNQTWKQKKMGHHPRPGHGTGGAGGAGETEGPEQPREEDLVGTSQYPERRDVHEPGTAALLVAGAMSLAALRRRRTR